MKNQEDRLQQFHELRRTIRGAGKMLVVGVDVAKDRHQKRHLAHYCRAA